MFLRCRDVTLATLLVTAAACSKDDQPDAESGMDLNGDGKPDIFYADRAHGYYELVDRNFDGKVDESAQYDDDHRFHSSESDENFDGHMETKSLPHHGQTKWVISDSTNDGFFDTMLEYEHGVLFKGTKHFPEESETEQIQFAYGYPTSAVRTPSDLSSREFHVKLLEKLRNHEKVREALKP